MSGGGVPLAVIPLRDGTELHITQEGVKMGERFYALANIQDARQVAPEPETVALRIAGTGLVEFQPARAGDGAVALDAIFRLRPELRPAGFALPNAPQAAFGAYPPQYMQPYPVYPPYTPHLGYMPGPMPGGMPPAMPPQPGYPLPQGAPAMPPPPGFPPPPPYGMPFAPNPNVMQPELTPIPRNFGQLLGAIFRLYGKHFRSFLLLGLSVALLPALLSGGLQTLWYMVVLHNFSPPPPPTSSQLTNTCETPFSLMTRSMAPPSTDQLMLAGGILAAVVVVLVFLGAWQTATLGIGARDAVLGRRISIGASVRGGLRRSMPTLGAQIIAGLISALFILPGYALLLIAFIPTLSLSSCASNTELSHTIALSNALILSSCVVLPLGLVGYLFFWVRLGFAPYAAATMRIGPGRALAASWRLTRGNWWRTFFVLYLMGLIVGGVGGLAAPVAFVYPPAVYLVIVPLIQIVSAPLLALTSMVLLSDLRLRREGYAAATQDVPPGKGTDQTPKADSTPPSEPSTQAGEATQQQQSTPPLG